MMLEFLGEADAAARVRGAVDEVRRRHRHHRRDRRRDRRSCSARGMLRCRSRRPRRSGWTASSSTGTRRGSTCSRTRCTTAPACSRASAPTRPRDGPAVFRLTDHIERLLDSAKLFMMDDPVLARRARRGRASSTVREQRARLLLRPADRVPRLRRDGAQPAAVRGERVDRGVAVGRVPRRRGPRRRACA